MFRVMTLPYDDDDCSKQDLDPDEAPQALFLMRLLLRHKPAAIAAHMDDADMAGLRAVIESSPCLLTVYLGESSPPANSASLTPFAAQAHCLNHTTGTCTPCKAFTSQGCQTMRLQLSACACHCRSSQGKLAQTHVSYGLTLAPWSRGPLGKFSTLQTQGSWPWASYLSVAFHMGFHLPSNMLGLAQPRICELRCASKSLVMRKLTWRGIHV